MTCSKSNIQQYLQGGANEISHSAILGGRFDTQIENCRGLANVWSQCSCSGPNGQPAEWINDPSFNSEQEKITFYNQANGNYMLCLSQSSSYPEFREFSQQQDVELCSNLNVCESSRLQELYAEIKDPQTMNRDDLREFQEWWDRCRCDQRWMRPFQQHLINTNDVIIQDFGESQSQIHTVFDTAYQSMIDPNATFEPCSFEQVCPPNAPPEQTPQCQLGHWDGLRWNGAIEMIMNANSDGTTTNPNDPSRPWINACYSEFQRETDLNKTTGGADQFSPERQMDQCSCDCRRYWVPWYEKCLGTQEQREILYNRDSSFVDPNIIQELNEIYLACSANHGPGH